MSKYEPLENFFRRCAGAPQLELSFSKIETILGFPLPESARKHRGWWSNERTSHVQARAWIDAGWRTWEVKLEKQKALFLPLPRQGVHERRVADADRDVIQVYLQALPSGVARLLRDYAAENGGDMTAAFSRALQDAVHARRNRLIDRIRANAPIVPDDSVDLIREDRDAR